MSDADKAKASGNWVMDLVLLLALIMQGAGITVEFGWTWALMVVGSELIAIVVKGAIDNAAG